MNPHRCSSSIASSPRCTSASPSWTLLAVLAPLTDTTEKVTTWTDATMTLTLLAVMMTHAIMVTRIEGMMVTTRGAGGTRSATGRVSGGGIGMLEGGGMGLRTSERHDGSEEGDGSTDDAKEARTLDVHLRAEGVGIRGTSAIAASAWLEMVAERANDMDAAAMPLARVAAGDMTTDSMRRTLTLTLGGGTDRGGGLKQRGSGKPPTLDMAVVTTRTKRRVPRPHVHRCLPSGMRCGEGRRR